LPYHSSRLRVSMDRGDPFLHKKIFKKFKGALPGIGFGIGSKLLSFARGKKGKEKSEILAIRRQFLAGPGRMPLGPIPFAPQIDIKKGDVPGFPFASTDGKKRYRRMNPANGKANRRAIRRLKGGEKQAKDLLRNIGYRTISKSSGRGHGHARAVPNIINV